MTKAYQFIPGLCISYEDIFLAALYAAAGGEAKAIKWIRKKARRAWREIEAIAANEMLSSLPETVEGFFEELKNPDLDDNDVERWADALGTTANCAICSTTVVQLWAFAEAIVHRYGLSDDDGDVIERIVAAIEPTGLETGGWGNGSLCAYHNEQQAKKGLTLHDFEDRNAGTGNLPKANYIPCLTTQKGAQFGRTPSKKESS